MHDAEAAARAQRLDHTQWRSVAKRTGEGSAAQGSGAVDGWRHKTHPGGAGRLLEWNRPGG